MRAEKHQNYAQKCPSWLPPGACCRLSLGSGQQHLGFVLQGLGGGGRTTLSLPLPAPNCDTNVSPGPTAAWSPRHGC